MADAEQKKKEKKEKKAKKRKAEEEAEGAEEAKKPRQEEGGEEGEVARLRVPIAFPMSDEAENLTKNVYSLVKHSTLNKTMVRGIKDVTKVVRKDKAKGGIVALAADVSPMDCVAHLPLLLEEKEIPYVWVPSRHDLGSAAQSKRPTSVILVKGVPEEKAKVMNKVKKIVGRLHNALETEE
eukprot:Hpha_TRINITY_DN15105_c0_g1::TRINITY_DN15105_c0_g1_i1::g.126862::m.126862/K11129/NHP2, NOLA2; H/ACA ribonucleoprotein complex subunit 2